MDSDAGVIANLTPLGIWAAQIHEFYTALQDAGFTETEALTLVTGMLAQPDND